MVPPAPGRFSTRNGCPMAVASLSATGRAIVSVAEPGVNGTMIRTGFEGKVCANALETTANATATSHFMRGSLSIVEALDVLDPPQGGAADPVHVGWRVVQRIEREVDRAAAHQQK